MNAFATIGMTAIVLGIASAASAATLYNPADALDEFSAPSLQNSTDFGIAANQGVAGTGDNALVFTTRPGYGHAVDWNVSGDVTPGVDTLSFDVRKHTATPNTPNGLTLWIWHDGNTTTPYGRNYTLDTTYQHISLTMPTGLEQVDKITLIVNDNGIITYFDNFTLTTVPEPVSMSALGLGSILLMHRRRRA